jgi:hypothetical protein
MGADIARIPAQSFERILAHDEDDLLSHLYAADGDSTPCPSTRP